MPLLTLLAVNAAVSAVAFLALWLVSLRIKDVSFIDAWWGPGMALLAWSTLFQTPATPHGLLLTGLCTVWAARLGGYLFWRWSTHGADRRYVAMIDHAKTHRGWSFAKTALLFVFLPQAFLGWLTSLPVQLGQVEHAPAMGWIGWIGALIVVVGIAFESIGDAQLSAFRKDPANKGKVLDSGLWRYTRHPNYFGDACTWWGIWLVAAETGPLGWVSIIGPLFLTFTLTKWSGKPLLEKGLKKSRPGYADYVERTSGFFPWPPRNH